MMLTRKKPWNRPSLAVYSVSSKGLKPNMHICTYVSAVSMQPKRMMVALFYGTQTIENVTKDRQFVLQLLHESQYNLVNLLGKQSGKNTDKLGRLKKRQLTDQWHDFDILKEAIAVMQLEVINSLDAGDHCMYLCNVVAYKNLNNGEPLTTAILQKKGIIRA